MIGLIASGSYVTRPLVGKNVERYVDLCARCACIELRFERRYTMVVSCCSYGCANRFARTEKRLGFLSFSSRATEEE